MSRNQKMANMRMSGKNCISMSVPLAGAPPAWGVPMAYARDSNKTHLQIGGRAHGPKAAAPARAARPGAVCALYQRISIYVAAQSCKPRAPPLVSLPGSR